MLRQHLTHALALMKQNRLYTAIYLVGTGLAIAFSMVIFIVLTVKFAPIYPEYSRSELLTMKALCEKRSDGSGWSMGRFSVNFYNEVAPRLTHLATVAGVQTDNTTLNIPQTDEKLDVVMKSVHAEFWKLFSFDFVAGNAFQVADVEVKNRVVVITASLSKRLFATTQSVGNTITCGDKEYSVCGVVRDVSPATPATYAHAWCPLRADNSGMEPRMLGPLTYYMLPKEGKSEALREEVNEVFQNLSTLMEEKEYDLLGQPDAYWYSTFREINNRIPNAADFIKDIALALMALILIPAINLSGLISGRMNYRLQELGVRRAFGASRTKILKQILWENLILTLLGGIIGLFISYLVVLFGSSWVLTIFDQHNVSLLTSDSLGSIVTPEMLFSPLVLGISFTCCVLLNFVSALIPALRALRHSIVESLHVKR